MVIYMQYTGDMTGTLPIYRTYISNRHFKAYVAGSYLGSCILAVGEMFILSFLIRLAPSEPSGHRLPPSESCIIPFVVCMNISLLLIY